MIVVLLVVAGFFTLWLIQMPRVERMKKFKSWLVFAVIKAEKYFMDPKTGALKLQQVYEWAVKQYPWVELVITEEQFKEYVDEALEEMRRLLETNPSIVNYIEEQGILMEETL